MKWVNFIWLNILKWKRRFKELVIVTTIDQANYLLIFIYPNL